MLDPEIKDALTSVDADRVEELFAEHAAGNADADATTFVADLYRRGAITRVEYTRTQLLASVEVTAPTVLQLDRHRRRQPGAEEGTDLPDTESDRSSAKHDGTAGRQDAPSLGYTLLDAIDEGGMGEILIARDNDLGRVVAFKKIHAHVAEHAGMVERFFMEAQVTAQLQHPYIVPVYQLFEQGGQLGYAMKLIAGKTLAQLVKEARALLADGRDLDDEHSRATLLDHFLKVCDAIHYANRKGVLHRDLKPANIMVGAHNEVYVMDWGIARLLDGSSPGFEDVAEPLRDVRERDPEDRTQVGDAIGTPAYMSPEQARGDLDRLGQRSDQYALGLILFELLSYRRALSARSAARLQQHARDGVLAPLAPPEGAGERIPAPLAAIVAKATRREPEDRYATVRDFADDLRRFLRNEPVTAMPDTLLQKLGRWVVRHRVASINIVAYSLLACLALAAFSVYRQQQATLEAERRELHVDHMLSTVSTRASVIDARMLRIEGVLEGIAASAAALLAHGQPVSTPLYTVTDYREPGGVPPDLAPSPAYGTPISVHWPVYHLAPGVAMADVEATLRKLDPLRHGMRHLLLRSDGVVAPAGQNAAADQRIVRQDLPVIFVEVALQQGVAMGFPGHADQAASFDPREQPWYTAAVGRGRSGWLHPFKDAATGEWMLACATPITSDSGGSMGAAVVEVRLARVRNDFLDLAALPGIERLLLLDAEGDVIAVSDASGEHGPSASHPPLPAGYREELLEDIARQRSGFLTWSDDGRDVLLGYARLQSNGWYLAAEADAEVVQELY